MIVEVGAMDRASPYSSGFHRALLLNFIVTARIIRISMFSYRIDVSRRDPFTFAKETKIVSKGEEEVILSDLILDDFLHW